MLGIYEILHEQFSRDLDLVHAGNYIQTACNLAAKYTNSLNS